MKAETKIIRAVQKAAKNEEFQKRHIKNKEKDFIRNRKIGFSDVIMYTIANTKSPGALEAERFSKQIRKDISAAAICKARQKISYTAFEELFETTAKLCSNEKKYHGYRLLAVDGMKGELPKTPELTEKYRISPQSEQPIFHTVAVFDVINEIFIEADFHCGNANERELAGNLIDKISKDIEYNKEAQIWVFDRGFPSLEMIQMLMQNDLKFVMRVSKSFLKEVNDFRKSKYVDRKIHISRSKNNVKCSDEFNFDLRCVRITLPHEEEILITNLDKENFPKRYIKEIYKLRWGIETNFNCLKHSIFIEEFTSKSENGFKQDFFVSLLIHNFITCIVGTLNNDIPQKKEN